MLGKRTDGIISRYINRRFSMPITNFIVKHKIPLTPNQVSFISFFIGVLGALMYFFELGIIAGLLVQISSIVDGVDGELARATGMTSEFGGFMDSILDRFVDILIIFGLTYLVFLYNGSFFWVMIVTFFAVSGTIMVSYLHAAGERSFKRHPGQIGKVPNFASRDVRLFIIFIGSILGFYFETLFIIMLISNLYVVLKFLDILIHWQQ